MVLPCNVTASSHHCWHFGLGILRYSPFNLGMTHMFYRSRTGRSRIGSTQTGETYWVRILSNASCALTRTSSWEASGSLRGWYAPVGHWDDGWRALSDNEDGSLAEGIRFYIFIFLFTMFPLNMLFPGITCDITPFLGGGSRKKGARHVLPILTREPPPKKTTNGFKTKSCLCISSFTFSSFDLSHYLCTLFRKFVLTFHTTVYSLSQIRVWVFRFYVSGV